MTRNYQAEIDQKEKELQELVSDMETTVQQIIAATARFLADWFQKQARSEVERDSAVTLSLQPGQLKELKQAAQRHAEKAEDIARRHLNDGELWWHRKTPLKATVQGASNPYRSYDGHRPANIYSAPIKKALGTLALVLEPYGFAKPQGSSDSWRTPAGHGSRNSSIPYYQKDFTWPPELLNETVRYASQYEKAIAALHQIDELNQDKRRAEAAGMWDAL